MTEILKQSYENGRIKNKLEVEMYNDLIPKTTERIDTLLVQTDVDTRKIIDKLH